MREGCTCPLCNPHADHKLVEFLLEFTETLERRAAAREEDENRKLG